MTGIYPRTSARAARFAALFGVAAVAGCFGAPPGTRLTPGWGTDDHGEAPVIMAQHDAPAPADSVVLVSWNVHVGGGDLGALVDSLRSGALTEGSPPGAFAILVQEAHRSGPEALRPGPDHDGQTLYHDPPTGDRVDIVETARRTGLHLAYAPAEPNGRPEATAPDEDRGVAILSTHPLTDVRTIELPRERQRRVALIATMTGVRSNGTPWDLRVATAHLENRAPWHRVFESFGVARGRQAHALVDALGPGPLVLGADLNTWAPSYIEPALSVMEEHFPDTPDSNGGTYAVLGLTRRLDHLLFRHHDTASTRVTVSEHRFGSDHAPVIGLLELPSPAVQEIQYDG